MTGPFGRSSPPQQRRRDPLAVAAVAQLAEELVDEVAPVGEDQHAAGARRLDEAERGDGLAGAGRVLEPEALGGVGVLGLLAELLLVLRGPRLVVSSSQSASGASASARSSSASSSAVTSSSLLVLVLVLGRGARELIVVLVLVVARAARRRPRRPRPRSDASGDSSPALLERGASCSSSSSTPRIAAPASTSTAAPFCLPLPLRAAPRRAAPSAFPRAHRPGGPRASSRRRASARPRRARARVRAAARTRAAKPVDGNFRPASSSASAWSSARRRGVPGASASAGSSPGCTKGSRVNFSARARSASPGRASDGH